MQFTQQIYPSATRQFFAENPTTIRSADTRRTWGSIYGMLQRRYPTKRIGDITTEDLVAFLTIDDAGKPRQWAPGTVLAKRTAICSLFSWAAYAGLIPTDPASTLKRAVRVRNTSTKTHTWLTELEIQALFDACTRDGCALVGARDAAAIGFGVLMGLRVHEIVKARWTSLAGARLSLVGKGAKGAVLPVPAPMVDILGQWRALCADTSGPILIPIRRVGGPTFGTEWSWRPQYGRQLSSDSVQRAVSRRGAEIGHPQLAPHDLRRSFAGLLEAKGVEIRDIQALLRHDSVATTEIYLKDNPAKLSEAAVGALGGFSFGAGGPRP